MKGALILLDQLNGRQAAALVKDGQLQDLLMEVDQPGPGTIYRAEVDRPIKGQGGVFLNTPDGSAFLRHIKGLAPKQMLLVQVTGYAEPGKALPVTSKLLFKSRYVIVTPTAPGLNISRSIRDEDRRDMLLELIRDTIDPLPYGMILRSSCADADPEDIAEDANSVVKLATQVLEDDGQHPALLLDADTAHEQAWRDWSIPAQIETDDGCFAAHGVLDQIEALSAPDIAIKDGSFSIEQTRAFVAVDVNTGKDSSPAAGLKANIAMARDLPRQLRLRGLGGQIVIDPAPMPKKDRRQLETIFRAALRSDTVETNFVGWTKLGLIELQRARSRAPLSGLDDK